MGKYFTDLRFIIGLFFAIVSGFLFIAAATVPTDGEPNMNFMVAQYMIVFAIAVMAAGIWSVVKERR